MSDDEKNGWSEWKQLILYQLKEQGKDIHAIEKSVGDINVHIARLQLKAGVWGGLAGMIPVLIFVIWKSVG